MKINKLLLLLSLTFVISQAQTWTPIASLPGGYAVHHGFGFSAGGFGYLVGGVKQSGTSEVDSNSVFKYNPTTNTWTQLADFPGTVRGYAIGDFYNGKAYFGFGESTSVGTFKDLWVFDPATETWSQLASCTCPGRSHPAFVALNGQIHVGMGGGTTSNLKDWWVYNMSTNTWSQKLDIPSYARHHPFQFGVGSYVYAGLGHGSTMDSYGKMIYRNLYRYDISSNTWTQMAEIPAQGRVAGTQFSYNNRGFVLSGEGDTHQSMTTGEFWSYNPTTNAWSQLPSHPGASRWAPASFIINGEVYLISGQEYRNYVTSNYKFNLNAYLDNNDFYFENDQAVVYPTVFDNEINIKLIDEKKTSESTISICNVNGQKVYEQTYSPQLNLSNLTAGMYFMEIKTGSAKQAVKIIKR
ncbi:MAG: kelch repeat-containing protein [Limnohabitans sp.]|nr:kelch repeat-containing protein [Limnohabitans sp.]